MHYFQIISDFADLVFPWAMLINGFALGLLAADHFHTKAKKDHDDGKDGESK